jgi:hypothetical protein
MFIVEAINVGFVTAIMGLLINYAVSLVFPAISISCPLRNQMVMFFLIGFFVHSLFELLGLNAWYCKHGIACRGK